MLLWILKFDFLKFFPTALHWEVMKMGFPHIDFLWFLHLTRFDLWCRVNLKARRQRNNTTLKALVGDIGQGKASKAQREPTDPITHRMRGLGTWRHAEGVPHACTARRAWFTHPCGWDYVLGQVNQVQQNTHAPSLTGLSHKAEVVPQAAIPCPKTPSRMRSFLKPSPKRPSLQRVTPVCEWPGDNSCWPHGGMKWNEALVEKELAR